MGIFNRVNDVVQSNIVALLDKAEDPKKLVNLLLIDMQDALNECRTTAAALLCEEKVLKRYIASQEKSLAQWHSKAEVAVSRGRDDLAKLAIAEKQKLSEGLLSKEVELTKLKESIANITEDCASLQQKLAQVKIKQAQLAQRNEVVVARERIHMQINSNKVEHALSRFEEIEQRVESIEAQVEAYELGCAENTTAVQIEMLVKNEKIDAELASLKANLNTQTKQRA
jgi:phage shock protein A